MPYDKNLELSAHIWLLYEVILFYVNILAIFIFLIINVFLKYHTKREKCLNQLEVGDKNKSINLSKNIRYEFDILDFAKDDIKVFLTTFQTFLFSMFVVFVAYSQSLKDNSEDLTWVQFIGMAVCGLRHLITMGYTLNQSFNLNSSHSISNKMIYWNALLTSLVTIGIIVVYSLNFNVSYNKRHSRRVEYIEPYLLFEAVLGVVKLGDLVFQ